jgi:S-adenosylmethionine:tRNA ribosyltransferase-isomerase
MNTLERLLEFDLPAELEAHEPPEARGLRRDGVRLMVSERATNRISHAQFIELPRFLRPGDLLVANDSATLPAALTAHQANGTEIALHLSTRLPGGLWVVEPRQTTAVAGEALALPGGAEAVLLAPYADSRRLWVAQLQLPEPLLDYLARWGRPIAYPYVRDRWPIEMYQTVYAREPGSAEMPSAGRAFTPEVLAALAERGVGFATLTLHTGVASLEAHEPPYEEWYEVPASTADAVNSAKAAGRRVIGVGTTVVRALESAAEMNQARRVGPALQEEHADGTGTGHVGSVERKGGRVVAARAWTDLVITPDRGVQVVDGLLTGFHEPRATHLAMLEAIAGRAHLEKAYAAALKHRYLWHEFGDLHLIL